MRGSLSQRLLHDRHLVLLASGCSAVAALVTTTIFFGGEQDKNGKEASSKNNAKPWRTSWALSSLLAASPAANKKVLCESSQAKADHETTSTKSDDSYPNFSRHGHKSILARYLTPEMYAALKDKRTSKFGSTLEDMIQAGVALPFGADPPRGLGGVFAGDAECYQTFAPLLHPLIEEYHEVHLHDTKYHAHSGQNQQHQNNKNKDSDDTPWSSQPLAEPQLRARGIGRHRTTQARKTSRIRRQLTNLNPEHILSHQVDPSGNYVLYSRMRLARSIRGFAFAPMISRADRRRIETLFRDIVQQEFSVQNIRGQYVSVMDLTNAQHDDFISQRICFLDPDDYKIAAGLGRDWPDARGLFCSNWGEGDADHRNNNINDSNDASDNPVNQMPVSPNLIIWCNYDDHFWIMSFGKGGDVQAVFTRLSEAVNKLELGLLQRGHAFSIDPLEQLGFLNCSPVNIGTGLRASMSLKLIRLGKQDPELFDQILQRLHLEAKSDYAETDRPYTGIFEVANAQRVGKTEVQLINIMIKGVSKLIELEQKLESGEKVTLDDVAEDEEAYEI